MAILVAAGKWPHRVKLPKDPNARIEYQLDWSAWLPDGVSIVGLEVEVAGLTLVTSSYTSTLTTAWVSGGTVGSTGEIRYRITTDSTPVQQIDDRTLILNIAER